ncbi:MAG: hypothetical protein GY859_40690 [Desulfobacterales bacterium]|nr:hypothetical protein [Desulfobacterales bacterium]
MMKENRKLFYIFACALLGMLMVISPAAMAGRALPNLSHREGHINGAGGAPGAHPPPAMGRADGARSDNCMRLDGNLNFTAPCMDLEGARFGITFKHNGENLWEADASSYSAAGGNAACIV